MIALVMVVNILSKNVSGLNFGTRQFFASQVVSFGCGSIALIMLSYGEFSVVAFFTVCCAVVYGIRLRLFFWDRR